MTRLPMIMSATVRQSLLDPKIPLRNAWARMTIAGRIMSSIGRRRAIGQIRRISTTVDFFFPLRRPSR